jgi:rod shape-determining protein MreD
VSLGKLTRIVLLVVVTLIIQSTIGLDVRIAGAHPDLMLLLPIVFGIAGGPEDGALVGFLAGMAADLLLPTPLGLSALVDCLVGFAVGASTGTLTLEIWWIPPFIGVAGSVVGVLAYAVLGAVLGDPQFLRVDLVAIVAVVAVTNGVLANAAARAARWALGPTSSDHDRLSFAGRKKW